MHELLEAHCPACGFSLKGLDAETARSCGMCGIPLSTRSNLSISRKLPVGLGLLMGAFAASLDASPLLKHPTGAVPGFARRWP